MQVQRIAKSSQGRCDQDHHTSPRLCVGFNTRQKQWQLPRLRLAQQLVLHLSRKQSIHIVSSTSLFYPRDLKEQLQTLVQYSTLTHRDLPPARLRTRRNTPTLHNNA